MAILSGVTIIFALACSGCGGDDDKDVDSDIVQDDADLPHDEDADSPDSDGERDGEIVVDGDVDADVDWRQELEIITWNIESFPLTSTSTSMTIDILSQLNADIIAVQEIQDGSAFQEVVSALDGYDGILADDDNAYIRVGLIWRTGRVVVNDSETLFRHDGDAFPRPPLMAEISVMNSSNEVAFDFNIVVLHLKALMDDESRLRRLAACEALDAWITASIGVGADPDFIVLGDWNDELTDYEDQLIFSVFLDHPQQYTFLTLELEEAGGSSYLPFHSFLDHILITNDALDEYGLGTTEVLTLESTVDNYRDVSDHRPVRSTFLLP